MSVVTTNTSTNVSESPKKRVQIIGDNNSSPTFSLDQSSNQKLMFTPIDLPTTAELMQRCLAVNPFEAKFREANQKISSGGMPPTSAAHQSLEALEANGLVPIGGGTGCLPTSANMTEMLLKIPHSTLQQSPGIFSNISILAAADGDSNTRRENLKTADISKLLSAVSAGDMSAQAPRTADVLNAVLDMHSDRLHTINYLNNKPDFSALLRSPSSSAPNSASILSAAMAIPSTSGGFTGLLVPNKASISSMYSPFGSQSNLTTTTANTNVVPSVLHQQKSPAGSVHSNGEASHLPAGPDEWELKVKKEVYYPDEQLNMMQMDRMSNLPSNGSDSSRSSSTMAQPPPPPAVNPVGRPPNSTSGRGRGRGRTTTADMLPDDRRNTILERNKAAAVRYRKRKKEEHDDMMGRVHEIENQKQKLMVQNEVLRRELERMKALLQEREQRCVCLKGIPLSSELRSESELQQQELLVQQHHQLHQSGMPNNNGMYAEHITNGLHLKRQKM